MEPGRIAGFAATMLLLGVGCADEEPAERSTRNPAAVVEGRAYEPGIVPTAFVREIDNPYLPLTPGLTLIYEGVSDGERERVEVTVTSETKQVMGVTATVVRDRAFAGGELVEDTFDWFAQDRQGNVWYFGEETAEYKGGEVVTRAGSWEAGVDGARPGIVMLAEPQVGDTYRQEYYEGEAEDMARGPGPRRVGHGPLRLLRGRPGHRGLDSPGAGRPRAQVLRSGNRGGLGAARRGRLRRPSPRRAPRRLGELTRAARRLPRPGVEAYSSPRIGRERRWSANRVTCSRSRRRPPGAG